MVSVSSRGMVPMPAATRGPRWGAAAAPPRGRGRGDWVYLVLVKANSASQVDLDLVGGGQATDQVGAAHTQLLRDRDERGGCCHRGGSTPRPKTCRGSRARARRRCWPRPPIPP